MSNNPYESGDAVLVPATLRPRRPALVWITQLILGFIVLLHLYVLGVMAISLPKILASAVSQFDLLYAISFSIAQLVLASILFVGLAKGRKWSWYAGILFAVLVMVFVFYTRAHPSAQTPPTPANQLLGAAIGEFIVTILIVVYPLRMYFSKKVRSFLVT